MCRQWYMHRGRHTQFHLPGHRRSQVASQALPRRGWTA
jgi:hypothetical protein